MKKLYVLSTYLAAMLLLLGSINAQTSLLAKQQNLRHQLLNESFANYQVFELDISKLQALTQSGQPFSFDLNLEQEHWNVYLEHNDLRGPNYREVAVTKEGHQLMPPRANITFKGRTGTAETRFTITPDYLIARLVRQDKVYYLEPLSRLIDGLSKQLYVYYEVEDILSDPKVECVHHVGKRYALPQPEDHKPNAAPLKMMDECVEVEMATAGDFTMFDRYGSVIDVNDFILNVTNLMEPLYGVFNINFVIVDQFVVTSLAADPFDPSDTEAFDILDAFRPWAGANFDPHDLGQLWTDRDIRGCNGDDNNDDSTNFGLIGCADAIGDVCGSNRYNLCEDWSASSNCLRNISAHEIGHVFDGIHSLGSDAVNDMMGPNIACTETAFSAANIARMQAHIDSRNCLATCDPCDLDNELPSVTCPGFSMTFNRCPDPINPNTPSGIWVNIPANGMMNLFAGGSSSFTVDLSGCVSDDRSDLADMEISLVSSYSLGTCPKSIFSEYAVRDECGNVSANRIIVEHIFTDNIAPVFDDFCALDLVFTTEDGSVCPADAEVSLNEGDELSVFDAWNVGGVSIDPLVTCLGDNCVNEADLVIRVDDINVVDDGNCRRTITVTFVANDDCGNQSAPFQDVYTFIDDSAPEFGQSCTIPIVLTTENGSACPADATISLNEGDELSVSDTWEVGGQSVPSLEGCLEDNCADEADFIITVNDIDVVSNSICNRIITVAFRADDGCGNLSVPFTKTYLIIDNTPVEFDQSCGEELVFTTEGGNVCPADAEISLNEGDILSVFDTWEVGGEPVPSLEGCLEDNCTDEADFIITVDDIDVVDDGTCSRTITVSFIADDGCGYLSDPFTKSYIFIDNTAAEFDEACALDLVFTTEGGSVCPADAEVSLNEGDELSVFDTWNVGGEPIASLEGCLEDNCADEADFIITVDDIDVVDDGTCSRTITVSFIADDGCGNLSDPFEHIYTFIDDTAPEVSFNGIPDGGTYVIECDLPSSTWDPLIDIGELTLSDNCSDVDVAGITEVLTQLYDGPCLGNTLTRWRQVFTVMDVCGNTTVYTLFTDIIDTTAPVFSTSPDDVTIECDETAVVPHMEAFDQCSEVVYNYTEMHTPGSCPNNYTLTRTWTATDGCGNASEEVQIVTVEDTTPPVIEFVDGFINQYEAGEDVFINCEEYGNILQIIANNAVATDNCSGQTPVSYHLEDLGNFDCAEYGYVGHLVSTWTSTDECGNSSEASINWYLVDESAPFFQNVPEDVCVGSVLPPVAAVQAVDRCDYATMTFSQSEPIDCEGGQYIERTWTAFDACGNTSSVSQRIILGGGTDGPSISLDYPEIGAVNNGDLVQIPIDCSQELSFSLEALKGAIQIDAGCGSSQSDVAITLMNEGDCAENGYLSRYHLVVTASDACGNTTDFELTIDFVDQTGPVVDSPAAITLQCGEDIPLPTASDACGEVVDISFVDAVPIEASCANNPVAYDRTWTLRDACGNTTSFVQSISIIDATGPVFMNVPADACNDLSMDAEVSAIDACTGAAATVSLSEQTSNEAGCGQVLTRIWTATDACGNTSTATQQVFFDDDEAPTISFSHSLISALESGDELYLNVAVNMGDPTDPLLFTAADVVVTDNCADIVAEVMIDTYISDDCLADGYLARYEYLFTATDPCGNSATAQLTVYYVDKYGPDFYYTPEDVKVYCSVVPAVAEILVADDYDEDPEVVFNETHTPTADGLLITRTWTATDACGNTNTFEQQILVVNNDLAASFSLANPVIECNSDDNLLSVSVSGGTPPYTYDWQLTDPLEDGYITTEPTNPAVLFTMGYISQTFSVLITDANGCELLASITVECDYSDDEGDFLINVGNDSPVGALAYPNPANKHVYVQSKQLVEKAVMVRLYNVYGQQVLEQQIDTWPQEAQQLNTSRLPNGTYLLRLTAQGQKPISTQIIILH